MSTAMYSAREVLGSVGGAYDVPRPPAPMEHPGIGAK